MQTMEVLETFSQGVISIEEARIALGFSSPKPSNEETLKHIQKIAVEALPTAGVGAVKWRIALEEIDQFCSALLDGRTSE